jgi:hypothetical protein
MVLLFGWTGYGSFYMSCPTDHNMGRNSVRYNVPMSPDLHREVEESLQHIAQHDLLCFANLLSGTQTVDHPMDDALLIVSVCAMPPGNVEDITTMQLCIGDPSTLFACAAHLAALGQSLLPFKG